MEEKKPSERVMELVKPYLTQKGFNFKKSATEFLRKFPLGRQRFSLCFDGRGGLVTVNCGFFIYFDKLITLYGKIFSENTGDWDFQIGENNLRFTYKGFENNPGFLFDEKFGKMSLSEKSKYNSYQVHPEQKIIKGADSILKAFDLYAEHHFDYINNYENLFEALTHMMRIANKKIPFTTPFLNLNLPFNEEKVLYYGLILALCLGKETSEIDELANDILNRYTNKEEVIGNIQKIYAYHQLENLKNILS